MGEKMKKEKQNEKTYEIVIDKNSKITVSENEIVEIVAKRILTKNKQAFEKLAQ